MTFVVNSRIGINSMPIKHIQHQLQPGTRADRRAWFPCVWFLPASPWIVKCTLRLPRVKSVGNRGEDRFGRGPRAASLNPMS